MAKKVVQKTAELAADNATIAANITRKGLLLLEKLFDDYAEKHMVTEHRESCDGVVDVKRLRDLTSAYKDLTEDLPKESDNGTLEKLDRLLQEAWDAAHQ